MRERLRETYLDSYSAISNGSKIFSLGSHVLCLKSMALLLIIIIIIIIIIVSLL